MATFIVSGIDRNTRKIRKVNLVSSKRPSDYALTSRTGLMWAKIVGMASVPKRRATKRRIYSGPGYFLSGRAKNYSDYARYKGANKSWW